MQLICESTRNASVEIQIRAYWCLADVMGLYCDKMFAYMEQALFNVSVNYIGCRLSDLLKIISMSKLNLIGLNSSVECIVLHAIEFWTNACEDEICSAIEEIEV